jgi:hypothetical protein
MQQGRKKKHWNGIPVTIGGEQGHGTKMQVDGNDLDWITHKGKGVACIQTAKLPDGSYLVTSNRIGAGYIQASEAELAAFVGGIASIGIGTAATA